MIGDFNIRDSDWDLSYSYHSIHTDTLHEVADSLNLDLFTSINSVPTQYANNLQDLNLVIKINVSSL